MINAKLVKRFLSGIFFLVLSLTLGCSGQDSIQNTKEQDYALSVVSDESIFLFDYENIDILINQSIGIKIKNINIFLDYNDDIVIYGEISNNSEENITDIETTFDIKDNFEKTIASYSIPVGIRYLQKGKGYPFAFHYSEKNEYIKIENIRIGANYKTYNNDFLGNPIAKEQKYYYQDNILTIEGQIVNIGRKRVEDLMVLATFYDNRDRVVFIRECYIEKKSLPPMGQQEYILELNIDGGLSDFTHYDIEVYFNDAL